MKSTNLGAYTWKFPEVSKPRYSDLYSIFQGIYQSRPKCEKFGMGFPYRIFISNMVERTWQIGKIVSLKQ